MEKLRYSHGLRDGLPICFAYLAVSFTFGLKVVQLGLSKLVGILISATNLTSAGQFAGVKMIALSESFIIVGLAVFIINSRYMLMSLSISQFLPQNTSTLKRLLMSFFVTDEIFAVSYANREKFSCRYFMGLATTPFLGWTIGTTLGVLINSLLPVSLQNAMGIALYCMFIAIIIPPAKKSKPIFICIVISIILSCVFYFVPYVNKVPMGVSVIICSLASSCITAKLFPLKGGAGNA